MASEADDQVTGEGDPPPARGRAGVRGQEGNPHRQARQTHHGWKDALETHSGPSVARGAHEIAAPEADDQVTVEGDPPAAQGRAGVGGCQGPGSQASRGQGDADEGVVQQDHRAACGAPKIAAPEEYDQGALEGAPPAAQEREGVADPDREAGNAVCQAPRERGRAAEGPLRQPERAAGETALGAQARPAARISRPRTHPATRA